MGAASVEDFREVERIVDRAVAAQVRPIDILLGLVAPSLYLIGEQWRKGAITVTQEHRFSAFCEKVYQLVVEKVMSQPEMNLASTRPEALLVNAEQNHHTLAIRILALWFKSKGIEPLALYPFPGLEVLINLVEQMRPRLLLISIALAEQRSSVVGIVERLKSSSIENKPKVVIGGYAVKSGMIAPIAGASLVVDISQLEELVGSWAREQP
jgi:methanogenic corrinoid protein MtbC1